MQYQYNITGMHCGSCVAKLTEALRGVEGVTDATVTLKPPQAVVMAPAPVPMSALQAAVAAKGGFQLAEPAASAVEGDDSTMADPDPPSDALSDSPSESLYPLLLIVGYIFGVVVLIELMANEPSWMRGMRHFMAGFFLVFSFFKLLDPPGFVDAYRGYDLLARRSKVWAWAYPFVELLLGIAYLTAVWPVAVNAITLVLMTVGAWGVLQAVLDKRAIRCACLGTALNLPMTKVTLVEDLTMAAMAAAMLVMHLTSH